MAAIVFYHCISGYLAHTSHHRVLRKWFRNEWINEENIFPSNQLTSKILISSILPFDRYHLLSCLLTLIPLLPLFFKVPGDLQFIQVAALFFSAVFVSSFLWFCTEITLFQTLLTPLPLSFHHDESHLAKPQPSVCSLLAPKQQKAARENPHLCVCSHFNFRTANLRWALNTRDSLIL